MFDLLSSQSIQWFFQDHTGPSGPCSSRKDNHPLLGCCYPLLGCCCSGLCFVLVVGNQLAQGLPSGPRPWEQSAEEGKLSPWGMLLSFLGCRLSSLVVGCQDNQSSSPLKCSCELLAVESSCCNFVKIVSPFQYSDAIDGCLPTLHTSL